MTNTFCPLLRETCKGNECMMFKDEECLIASFLATVREGAPTPEDETSSIERSGLVLRREEEEVPDWIKNRTPEELAVEILEFVKERKKEGLDYYSASRQFWECKGVHEFLMPVEAQTKIQRAEYLTQKQTLQEEKEELPSLVNKCVDWARTHNMRKVAVADVDAFLFDEDLHLLRETKRALYSKANVKLKSNT